MSKPLPKWDISTAQSGTFSTAIDTPITSATPFSSRVRAPARPPGSTPSPSEKLIVDEIRANVLTESNIRDLVKLLDEEMTAWLPSSVSGWRPSRMSLRT